MDKSELNQYLQPKNTPITRPKPVVGYTFDMQNEIQGRLARLSNINVKNFIFQTGTSTASFSIVNNGSASILSSAINNPPHSSDPMVGEFYTALYEGTTVSSALQIYPQYGASVNPLSYRIWSGRDWNAYRQGTTENTAMSIVNVSGSTQNFYFVNQMKFIQYNANQV